MFTNVFLKLLPPEIEDFNLICTQNIFQSNKTKTILLPNKKTNLNRIPQPYLLEGYNIEVETLVKCKPHFQEICNFKIKQDSKMLKAKRFAYSALNGFIQRLILLAILLNSLLMSYFRGGLSLTQTSSYISTTRC